MERDCGSFLDSTRWGNSLDSHFHSNFKRACSFARCLHIRAKHRVVSIVNILLEIIKRFALAEDS